MGTLYSPFNPENAIGFDYYCTDGGEKPPPKIQELGSKEAHEWFSDFPEDSLAAIRLITVYQPGHASLSRLPWSEETVDHALWSPKVYTDLASTNAGGVAALLDEPFRFILQTPVDDGPFCSFALSKRGYRVKGVYIYSVSSFDGEKDDCFEPAELLDGEPVISGWRSTGHQIINVPSAFLRKHSAWMARQIARITARMDEVEAKLFGSTSSSDMDFQALNRALHWCSTRLLALERRSQLEKQTIAAIESVCAASSPRKYQWYSSAALKNQVQGRDYDFASLPRRITSAREAINTLINQRNQATQLLISESSQRIAQATLSDAASMKTIAVLTMLFLPGTAVASFFSIQMFNWNASDHGQIASPWIWLYFVIAVPLTAMVMVAWYWWWKRAERTAHLQHGFFPVGDDGIDHGPVEVGMVDLAGANELPPRSDGTDVERDTERLKDMEKGFVKE